MRYNDTARWVIYLNQLFRAAGPERPRTVRVERARECVTRAGSGLSGSDERIPGLLLFRRNTGSILNHPPLCMILVSKRD